MRRFDANLIIRKTFGSIRRPVRIHAVHFADRPVLGEAVDDRDIVCELRFAKLGEGRKLSFGLRVYTEAQYQFAAVQKPIKRACPPAFGRLPFRGPPVLGQRRFRLFLFPAERPPPREWGGACRRAASRARAAVRPRPRRGCKSLRPERSPSVLPGPLSRARSQASAVISASVMAPIIRARRAAANGSRLCPSEGLSARQDPVEQNTYVVLREPVGVK